MQSPEPSPIFDISAPRQHIPHAALPGRGVGYSSPGAPVVGRSAAQPPRGYQTAAVPPTAEIFATPRVSRACRLCRTMGRSPLVSRFPFPAAAFGTGLPGEHSVFCLSCALLRRPFPCTVCNHPNT